MAHAATSDRHTGTINTTGPEKFIMGVDDQLIAKFLTLYSLREIGRAL